MKNAAPRRPPTTGSCPAGVVGTVPTVFHGCKEAPPFPPPPPNPIVPLRVGVGWGLRVASTQARPAGIKGWGGVHEGTSAAMASEAKETAATAAIPPPPPPRSRQLAPSFPTPFPSPSHSPSPSPPAPHAPSWTKRQRPCRRFRYCFRFLGAAYGMRHPCKLHKLNKLVPRQDGPRSACPRTPPPNGHPIPMHEWRAGKGSYER